MCNQNDSTFQAKRQLDDNTVAQYVKMIHEYFYRKMQHHVMIYQLRVFDKNHSYNSQLPVINRQILHVTPQSHKPVKWKKEEKNIRK